LSVVEAVCYIMKQQLILFRFKVFKGDWYLYSFFYVHFYECFEATRTGSVMSLHAFCSTTTQPWGSIFMDLLRFCTCLSDSTFPTICYAVLKRLSLLIPTAKLEKLKNRNSRLKQEFCVSPYNYITNNLSYEYWHTCICLTLYEA
jgi:hypothetical protein